GGLGLGARLLGLGPCGRSLGGEPRALLLGLLGLGAAVLVGLATRAVRGGLFGGGLALAVFSLLAGELGGLARLLALLGLLARALAPVVRRLRGHRAVVGVRAVIDRGRGRRV